MSHFHEHAGIHKNRRYKGNLNSSLSHPHHAAEEHRGSRQARPQAHSSEQTGQRIRHVYHLALKAYGGNDLMAQLATTQAITESGVNLDSLLARKYHNIFGMTGIGTAGSVTLPMREFVKNVGWTTIPATFAAYHSMEEAIRSHAATMENDRYAHVRNARSFAAAALAVQKAGYASNPHYARDLNYNHKAHILPSLRSQAATSELEPNNSEYAVLRSTNFTSPPAVKAKISATVKTPPTHLKFSGRNVP